MTMDNLRLKIDQRQHGKNCFIKKYKFLNVETDIPVWQETVKIFLIVYKVIGDSVHLILKDSHILFFNIVSATHIKMSHILKLVPPVLRDTSVIWNYHADIPFIFVKFLRQGAAYIRKPSRFDKWYTFRCCKQNFSHFLSSKT